jgi:hypothetical protein
MVSGEDMGYLKTEIEYFSPPTPLERVSLPVHSLKTNY